MLWTCPRCAERSSLEVPACARCGTVRGETPVAPLLPPPKKLCPKCRVEVQDPPVMARFKCRACGHDFDDYEDWVRRCRAAAYAAQGPKRDLDGSPGPEPKLLKPVALALLVGAPLNALAALWTGSPALLLAGLLSGALGAVAGALLLRKAKGADVVARIAASVAALLPFLVLTAPLFVWVVWELTEREWLRHFRSKPVPASRIARLAVSVALGAAVMIAGTVSFFPGIDAGSSAWNWGDPAPFPQPALRWLFGAQAAWFVPGLLAFPFVLWAACRTSRRAFLVAGNAAIVLLLAGSAASTASSLAYLRGDAEARLTLQERSVSALLWKLKETDPRVRIAAARALRETSAPSVTGPALKPALEDPDPRVRREAAVTLARIAPSAEAAAVLTEEFKKGWPLQLELSWLGPLARPALDLLLQRLPEGGFGIDALVEIGAPSVPGLTASLAHADPKARWAAAEALRRLGASARSGADALTKSLADPDAGVRSAAAAALAEVLREKSIPPLSELKGRDATSAAPALCSLGEKEGLKAVREGGSFLNALRRPGLWDHLGRAPVDFDLDGSLGQILDQIAVSAVMCIESGPGAPPLSDFRRIHGASRKRSALDVLRSTDLEFVLEEDKIRILGPAEAKLFWKGWLSEQPK